MVVDDAKRVISSKYQKMLKNIIDLENVRVEDIMIPRNELISVNINKQDELLEYLKRVQHTRLLIYKDTPDNITGVLHMRNVVNLYANEELASIMLLIKSESLISFQRELPYRIN